MKHGTLIIAGLGIAAILFGGCRYRERGFESPDPGERMFAVTDAARTRDPASVPHLITLLRSDDPLVRMTSIRTLELMTGTTMGYDHAAPERQREEAVLRWAEWYRQQHGGEVDLEAEPDPDLRFQGR